MRKIIFILLTFIVVLSISILTLKFTGLVSYSNVENCMDSDFGINFKEKGAITGESLLGDAMQPIYYSKTDYCENENTLVEYYCIKDKSASKKAYKKYQCEDSCLQGACINGGAKEIFFISPASIIILLAALLILFILFKNAITGKLKKYSSFHNIKERLKNKE